MAFRGGAGGGEGVYGGREILGRGGVEGGGWDGMGFWGEGEEGGGEGHQVVPTPKPQPQLPGLRA